MYRMVLLPELVGDEGNSKRVWRRILYSVVLTSVEFFLAILAVIAGLPVLLDPVSLALVPGSVVQLLPQWMVILWGGQLTIGGIGTIAGIMMSDFRIEQIGVLLLLSGAFIYTLALVTLLPASFMAFCTYILFVLAMAARYWVLGKLIKMTGRLNQKALDALPDKEREE